MLENADKYRIDVRLDEDAFYFWKFRDPQLDQWHKSGSFEDKQECLENIAAFLMRTFYWRVPIYDENGTLLGKPQDENDISFLMNPQERGE